MKNDSNNTIATTAMSASIRDDKPLSISGELIQQAVDSLDKSSLEPLSHDVASPMSQARALLALLVNCYAHGIYSSKAVAELATNDPQFPWFWWEPKPDAAALRRFREKNFKAIHSCLTAALQLSPADFNKKFAGVPTNVSATHVAEEASRRISMASFVDGVELNKGNKEEDPSAMFLFANQLAPAH